MDILQRLKEVLKYSGQSVRAFSIKCGVSQPTLDKQIKGLRSVSIETVMSVLYAYPEISAEWLMRGNGQMLIQQEGNSADNERMNKLIDTITTLQDTINSKNDAIATLSNRVMQLENQLGK